MGGRASESQLRIRKCTKIGTRAGWQGIEKVPKIKSVEVSSLLKVRSHSRRGRQYPEGGRSKFVEVGSIPKVRNKNSSRPWGSLLKVRDRSRHRQYIQVVPSGLCMCDVSELWEDNRTITSFSFWSRCNLWPKWLACRRPDLASYERHVRAALAVLKQHVEGTGRHDACLLASDQPPAGQS